MTAAGQHRDTGKDEHGDQEHHGDHEDHEDHEDEDHEAKIMKFMEIMDIMVMLDIMMKSGTGEMRMWMARWRRAGRWR